MNWILASGSPRRRELLEMLGVPDLTIRPATGPERATPGAGPEQTVRELSLHKAQEVAQTCAPEDIIIAADTIVYLDGAILGKPKNHDDAVRMLTALSGREHIVYTGVAVLRGGELRQAGADGREIKRLADHARGRDDDVLRRDVQLRRRERAHGPGRTAADHNYISFQRSHTPHILSRRSRARGTSQTCAPGRAHRRP